MSSKPPKPNKRRNPRSEAAMKWAAHNRLAGLSWYFDKRELQVTAESIDGEIIAIFDLRDCYRKRQPLKGITKAVRKAIAPRRKKCWEG